MALCADRTPPRPLSGGGLGQVAQTPAGAGVKTIQLRIKNLPATEVAPAIRDAVALGRRHGARLFINDYWQQAIEAGAWGVHLGQEDMETADLAAIQAAGCVLASPPTATSS